MKLIDSPGSDHLIIVIIIQKHDDVYTIYWKEGNDDHKHPKLLISSQKNIDKVAWDRFMNKLSHTNFWNMNATEITNGSDGAIWLLEGKTTNKYHVVDRWSPGPPTDYYRCCDFLIELTNLKISPNRKY
jgi:hypothetical protein